MTLETIAFLVFSTLLLVSATCVVTARNMVYAVIFLILSFFNAAGLFVLAGAEFLAMALVIVYVGAVAVLFLFVVMMLDIDFSELRKGMKKYLWAGLSLGGVLAAELVFVFYLWAPASQAMSLTLVKNQPTLSNTENLGRILYTTYAFPFQVAGLILLVAMIGAIVLALRGGKDVRRQSISSQVHAKKTIELVDVPLGEGIAR